MIAKAVDRAKAHIRLPIMGSHRIPGVVRGGWGTLGLCDVLGLDYSLVSGIPPSAAIGYKSSLIYGGPVCRLSNIPSLREFMLFCPLGPLCSVNARAQVVIDVSKITCDQFATYKIENPKYIVIWLSGYYHGNVEI